MKKYEDNPASIKYYVKRFLIEHAARFKNKKVIDFPAGNGVTTRILLQIGANPLPMDLFPEYFELNDIVCERANIRTGLPVSDKSADALICQEGIEHFSDQYAAFKEFNRVLKNNGTLLLTTPNYSNLRAKLSYLLFETERFHTLMPPNELDSIWMSRQDITKEMYFGHIFLIGIQKIRTLASLNGFRLKKYHFTRIKTTSLFLLLFLYPYILLSNWITYRNNLRKNKSYSRSTLKKVYREMFLLSINSKILTDGSLMLEFEKEMDAEEVLPNLHSIHRSFGLT